MFLITFLKDKKPSLVFEVFGFILYYISISIIYLVLSIPLLTIISNFLFFVLLSTLYTTKLRKMLLYSATLYVILGTAESLVLFASTQYINIFLPHSHENAMGLIIVRIITYSTVLILYNNKKNVAFNVHLPTRLWLGFLSIPLASIVIVFTMFSGQHISGIVIPISIFSIFVINVISLYLLDLTSSSIKNQYEEKMSEEQHKYYRNQMEIMEQSLNKYRIIRHDIKNLVSPLYDLIKKKKYDELSLRCEELLVLCSIEDIYAVSGHSTIDNILNFKLQNAKSEGVIAEVKTRIPKDLNIPLLDVAIILGNLIDNALEASKFTSQKKIVIELKYTKARLFITIINNYDGYIKPFENGFITRKSNKEEYGFGIKSVQAATAKHNGELFINYDENIFTAKAILFV
jgi:hypothetical protein